MSLDGDLRPYFFARYEEIYGHAHTHLDLEITTCRLNASGPKPRVELPEFAAGSGPDQALKGSRPAYFTEVGDFVDTPVYDRYLLGRGSTFRGPAIVEERESTAVIGPRGSAEIDRYGNLVVTLAG